MSINSKLSTPKYLISLHLGGYSIDDEGSGYCDECGDSDVSYGPWDYMMTTPVQTFKCFLTNYGGTTNRRKGTSKYWSPIGYIYYC